MPRDASSTYTLPAGNPVLTGTIISTVWANNTLNDIAQALTQSLSTDGSVATVSLAGKTITGGSFTNMGLGGTTNLTGGQIRFPSAQIPSANVNTLDDYEEGTFTPSITFATPGNLGVAYSARVGQYTKIGNRVILDINLVTSTFTWSTSSGTLRVSGLPFTALNTANAGYTLAVGSMAGMALNLSAGESLGSGFILANTNWIQFICNNFTTRANFFALTASVPSGGTQSYSIGGEYPTA